MSAMRDKIAQAIEKTIGENEPGLVTKWVALIESVDSDGERGLWCLSSDGSKSWEIVGMLTYAIHLEQGNVLRTKLAEDGD